MTPPLQTLRCPACDLDQTVPASSPRGFALRLRCRGCARALLADGDVTRMTASLEVPAAPVEPGWSLVVASEVVGPVDADEIRRYHRASVIDDDALVWHAGFRGWARLSETATFREMVGGRRSTPRCERPSVVDLTEGLGASPERVDAPAPPAGLPPVVTGDTVVAGAVPRHGDWTIAPTASRAGVYPIPAVRGPARVLHRRTAVPRSLPRMLPLLIVAAVAVGMVTASGVGLVAGIL